MSMGNLLQAPVEVMDLYTAILCKVPLARHHVHKGWSLLYRLPLVPMGRVTQSLIATVQSG